MEFFGRLVPQAAVFPYLVRMPVVDDGIAITMFGAVSHHLAPVIAGVLARLPFAQSDVTHQSGGFWSGNH